MDGDRNETARGGPLMSPSVLHVISGDLWAGAEVATFHLLQALEKRDDVEVAAVVLNEGELAERLRCARVPCEVIAEEACGFLALAREIRQRASGFDLVHAHRYKENLLAAGSGKPWLATQHGMHDGGHWSVRLRTALGETLDLGAKWGLAERVVAVSHAMRDRLSRRFGDRVVCIWNGIGDPWDGVAPQPWETRAAVCGVLARLVPVKGIELAIEAVARTPGVELEIIGDGPLRAELEARAAAVGGADRIRFLGFKPNPLRDLARWRCLLVTSHHEGHPIGVLESIGVGTPVLAAELPGVEEILAGRAGWSVPNRDPAAWSAAIEAAVHRVPEGTAVSRAARERFLEAFSAERAAREMAALYRDIATARDG